MNLDTLALAPDQPNHKPLDPIEQAAQQLADLVTQLATETTARNQHDTHEAHIRAENAEREYARLCADYERLLGEHEALKQQQLTTNTAETVE